jgi:hypothetical protein
VGGRERKGCILSRNECWKETNWFPVSAGKELAVSGGFLVDPVGRHNFLKDRAA